MDPLYECRQRRGVAFLLWLLGLAYAVAIGEPVWLAALFVAVLTLRMIQVLRVPLLRVFADRLEYRPWFPPAKSARRPTVRELFQLAPRVVRADEVERLAWDGSDNIGIRLRDGGLECVSFYPAHPDERATARERILAFVERATGGAPRAA